MAIEWPVFRPYNWGQPGSSRPLAKPWFGLDTERDAKLGDFVCGFAVGETIQEFQKITDLIPATYWVWNLGYDIEGMLRDLRISEAWAARADGSAFAFLGGTAVYYHGKRFDLKINKEKWHFIEASSFFGRQPLSKMGAKKNVDASKMSLERYQNDPVYRAEVREYCVDDARTVYNRITQLDASLRKMGVDIGATPGATARRFMNRLPPYPRVIWNTHKDFLRSYCGGRFEITKRGVIHELEQYDLVSAYPWALANCPWLTETAYSKITRRYSEDALYGSYEISFHYDNYLGVAPCWKNGIRVYSQRENSVWITRPELKWLLDRGVDVAIWRGLEIFDHNATSLWREIITELFAQKVKGKFEADGGWGPKIVLNSEYGILIQLIQRGGKWVPISEAKNPVDFAGILALEAPPKEFEGGKYFAPVYAANLTALTRCRLLDAAEAVGPEHYVGGHTDSVLTTKPLKHGLGKGLGDWELKDKVPRGDICKTGIYALGNSVKFRGITRDGTPDLLWQETQQRKTRIGIKSADTWEELSVIVPKTVANNYSVENKRVWFGEVTRGLIAMERFIDSEPLALVNG